MDLCDYISYHEIDYAEETCNGFSVYFYKLISSPHCVICRCNEHSLDDSNQFWEEISESEYIIYSIITTHAKEPRMIYCQNRVLELKGP